MTAEDRRRRYRERHPERVAASHRKYAATEARRLTNERYLQSEAGAAYRANSRARVSAEQKAAWDAVFGALKANRLVRQPCFCGRSDSHAHHHNGYDSEHALDVVWLCPLHHKEAHRAKRDEP